MLTLLLLAGLVPGDNPAATADASAETTRQLSRRVRMGMTRAEVERVLEEPVALVFGSEGCVGHLYRKAKIAVVYDGEGPDGTVRFFGRVK